MSLENKLYEAFEKGDSIGFKKLTAEEKDLYLTQEFILRYEMDGFSAYFYNLLPDKDQIQTQIDAIRNVGLNNLAGILERGFKLFEDYEDPKHETTWGEILKQYDPHNLLDILHDEIDNLDYYGVDS